MAAAGEFGYSEWSLEGVECLGRADKNDDDLGSVVVWEEIWRSKRVAAMELGELKIGSDTLLDLKKTQSTQNVSWARVYSINHTQGS